MNILTAQQLLSLAALKEIVETEPIYPDENFDYFCVYCDFLIDSESLHDELCPWAKLRELWET